MSTTINRLSIKTIAKQLEVHFRNSEAVLLLGEPGIGKTEVALRTIKQLLKKYQPKKADALSVIDGSGMPSESLVIPYIDSTVGADGDHLQRDVIPEFKRAKVFLEDEKNKNEKYVIFIDELSSFTQDDQRTLLNFIQSGLLPDGTLLPKDRIWVVMAGNPPRSIPGFEESDSPTHDIESAVLTRCATYFVDVDLDDWLDWGTQLDETGRFNLHPYLQSALRKDGTIYNKKSDTDVRYLINRTGKKLSDYLYMVEEMQREGVDIQWELFNIAAYIGDDSANILASIISQLDRLISVKELMGSDKDDEIKPAALKKFHGLEQFERYYLVTRIIEDGSGVDFKKKENVKKLTQIVREGNLPKEAGRSLSDALSENFKTKGTNAYNILSNKMLLLGKEYNVAQELIGLSDYFSTFR